MLHIMQAFLSSQIRYIVSLSIALQDFNIPASWHLISVLMKLVASGLYVNHFVCVKLKAIMLILQLYDEEKKSIQSLENFYMVSLT